MEGLILWSRCAVKHLHCSAALRGEDSTIDRASLQQRIRDALRREDIASAAVNALIYPLIARSGSTLSLGDLSDANPLVGLLVVAAAIGGIICLLSRTPEEEQQSIDGDLTPYQYATMPFACGCAILVSTGASSAHLPGEFLGGLLFLAAMVGFVWRGTAVRYMPVISQETRNRLLLPAIMAGSAVFTGTLVEFDDIFDIKGVLDSFGGGHDPSLIVFAFGLPVLVTGIFYGMFVFAPRQLANTEGEWSDWIIRFGVFFVSAFIGVQWARLIGVS